MIVDYKKKSNYSNLVTNHETEDELPANLDNKQYEHLPKLTATSKTNQVFEA